MSSRDPYIDFGGQLVVKCDVLQRGIVGGVLFTIGAIPLFFSLISGNGLPLESIPFILFVSIGSGLMLYRSGTIIDRRRGTITVWKGLLVPLKSDVYSLVKFDTVTITRVWVETSSNGNGD